MMMTTKWMSWSEAIDYVSKRGGDIDAHAAERNVRSACRRSELTARAEALGSWPGNDLHSRGEYQGNVVLPPDFFERAHFSVVKKGTSSEQDIATVRHISAEGSVGYGFDTTRYWCAEGIYFARADVEKLWRSTEPLLPDATSNADLAAVQPLQQDGPRRTSPKAVLDKVLEFADGSRTEAQVKKLVIEALGCAVPHKSMWRPAWKQVPAGKKRDPGGTDRTLAAKNTNPGT